MLPHGRYGSHLTTWHSTLLHSKQSNFSHSPSLIAILQKYQNPFSLTQFCFRKFWGEKEKAMYFGERETGDQWPSTSFWMIFHIFGFVCSPTIWWKCSTMNHFPLFKSPKSLISTTFILTNLQVCIPFFLLSNASSIPCFQNFCSLFLKEETDMDIIISGLLIIYD